MSKLKNNLSECLSIIGRIHSRQKDYIDRMEKYGAEAATTCKTYGISKNDALTRHEGAKAENRAISADIAALYGELREAADRLTLADNDMSLEWPNASNATLANLFKVIELSGKDMDARQAVSMAAGLRGDYISLKAVSESLRKTGNAAAADSVGNMIPSISATVTNMINSAAEGRNIKANVEGMARPLFEAAAKLGDDIGDPTNYDNLFELDSWREEAGLNYNPGSITQPEI